MKIIFNEDPTNIKFIDILNYAPLLKSLILIKQVKVLNVYFRKLLQFSTIFVFTQIE